MVVDSCKECGPGDLLLSYQGFANASGVNVNISPKLRVGGTLRLWVRLRVCAAGEEGQAAQGPHQGSAAPGGLCAAVHPLTAALAANVPPARPAAPQIAWAFESCAPLVEGGIRMLASPNNRANFLSLQFSNLRQPLRGVSVEGLELQRTRYGAGRRRRGCCCTWPAPATLQHGSLLNQLPPLPSQAGTWELNSPGRDLPLRPPLELALTGASGQRLTKALRTLASQDLGINFS